MQAAAMISLHIAVLTCCQIKRKVFIMT